ncbi:MAG: PRD domain-containing protein [Lachnospiraceae bacterium]|nr:PRD domain-containing protein [Lachnospiraceae bacterium]
MKVVKVINNNNLCVLDDNGREQIVSGKGIGFGKKYGDMVEVSQIQKTYLITDSELQKKMISMLKEIPSEYMFFTNDMVEHIKKVYPSKLNESLLVTLSDHIAFAIERKKSGIEFTNPLIDSIREAYPEELSLGEYCVEQIRERLDIAMSKDEAGFIAMHIINARLDIKMSDVYEITKMINGCIEIAEYYYQEKFQKDSVSYERFLTHLKYLAQRLFQNKPLPQNLSDDVTFVAMIKKTCNKHYKCAMCIQEYILKTYKKDINDDELITLAIHLKKVSIKAGF